MLNPFTKYFLASDIKDLNKEGRRDETKHFVTPKFCYINKFSLEG